MNQAVGFVEVFGFVTAIKAADAAAKAADVKIVALDKNKPAAGDAAEVPLIMLIKMQGSVSAVEAGVEAACAAAQTVSGVVSKHIIPSPEDDTMKLVALSAAGKDRIINLTEY